jgi:microcystin-dependent protein
MDTPYLAEIFLFAFGFPPKGYALCNGQLLPINQNQALFALLGTTYGGDGLVNFALPNLRGRAPGHFGNGYNLGEVAGASSHTLIQSEMPTHAHEATKSGSSNYTISAGSNADSGDPEGKIFAVNSNFPDRFSAKFDEGLSEQPLGQLSGNTGGGQAHTNMMPYLVLNYCIALQGVFPSQN